MTTPSSPTKNSSLLQELATSHRTMEQDNQQLREKLEQANNLILQLQNEVESLKMLRGQRKFSRRKIDDKKKSGGQEPQAMRPVETNKYKWVVPEKENVPTLDE